MKLSIVISAACLFAALPAAPQQAPSGEAENASTIAAARDQLRKAEAEHPGNTREIANALSTLLSAEFAENTTDAETPVLAQRDLAVSQAAAGTQSLEYLQALILNAEYDVVVNRPADARPLAEQAVQLAAQKFPQSADSATAGMQLSMSCYALGDFPCALSANDAAIATWRKLGAQHDWDLAEALDNLAMIKRKTGDLPGATAAALEALAAGRRARPGDPEVAVLENNLAVSYLAAQNLDMASEHLKVAVGILTKAYGPDNAFVAGVKGNLADVESRLGQFDEAWKNFDQYIRISQQAFNSQANAHANFARSLASGGNLNRAIDEGLIAARMGRENFLLEARVLPERQALAYEQQRPHGLDIAISVVAKHPELPATELVYQEILRSRAMVADEMARRQRGLNAANDSQTERLLAELNSARSALLALQKQRASQAALDEARSKMEKSERALAERSSAFRTDLLQDQITPAQLRHALPAHTVLVSYVLFDRRPVEKVDPMRTTTKAAVAFVVHPGSQKLQVFDLGDSAPILQAVNAYRSSVQEEAEGGGLAPIQSERKIREAGEHLRKLIWDPLRPSLRPSTAIYVVLDGFLRMVPLGALPDGNGYLIEHSPTIRLLSSERDLLASPATGKRAGLAVTGNPSFDAALTEPVAPAARLRETPVSCDAFQQLRFLPLPGSEREAVDVRSIWQRWNPEETAVLRTGADATRQQFLDDAIHYRVLHVATHAFLLEGKCGGGNPLLNAGLVFAGANRARESSILTAQQVASLDLAGVDLAVLSACNTGAGTPIDGEGVLGLERAFRVAGARNIVMSLWPTDDRQADHYMSVFYRQLFRAHRPVSDAAWFTALSILRERRAAGLSTHPWYWAGFVASGTD